MYLSMALIASELSDIINFSHLHKQNSAKVTGLRILSESDSFLDPDFLYICQPRTLSHLFEEHIPIKDRCFIIQEDKYENLEEDLKDSEYIFIAKQTSLFNFINRIESIFLSYGKWEKDMLSLCASSASFQTILEHAYEKIKIPMCILDVNHNVIAINKNVKTDDVLYNSMLKGYGYSYVDIINVSNPKITEVEKCSCKEVINVLSHKRLRVSAIKANGRPICYIGLHKLDARPFPDHVLDLFNMLIGFLEQRAANLTPGDIATHSTLFEQFVRDIIQKNSVDKGILYRALEHLNYKQFDIYKLYGVSLSNKNARSDSMISELMRVIERDLPNMKCFRLEPYLGILSKHEKEADFSRLKNLLAAYTHRLAVSNCFEDFCDIEKVWKQVLYIMDNWKESRDDTAFYDDYLIDHCITTIGNHFPFETLYHPAFQKLHEYDQENNTEYLVTLASYLQNKCSISATAAALYRHRNSLQYRIKKIEEILGIKITASDEQKDMLFASFFLRPYMNFTNTDEND